jgi:hypothetical protein
MVVVFNELQIYYALKNEDQRKVKKPVNFKSVINTNAFWQKPCLNQI